MEYILFDDPGIRLSLLPLTYSRPVAKIRLGMLTMQEKWAHYLAAALFIDTASYLQPKFNSGVPSGPCISINSALCPTQSLADKIKNLVPGQYLKHGSEILAFHERCEHAVEYEGEPRVIRNLWDIFAFNAAEIRSDFTAVTFGRKSAEITDKHTVIYNPTQVFAEEGVQIKASVLNAEEGPIYLGKNTLIQEGVLIKGPFAICEGSHINMGGKMRGDTTIGPYCKVGGEISNSVFFGFSNKAHDGFLGNSVIGEWCNLGADTNTSNLKNNYGEVQLYSYRTKKFENTGRQFCGLVMGDHSKAGINTMFNTGTVVGFNANIFGSGFPPKFIPSFSWGGAEGFANFDFEKSLEVAERVLGRRNMPLTETDRRIFESIYKNSKESETALR